MKWFTQRWSVTFRGHTLEAVNQWNLLLQGREQLWIDGEMVDEHRGFAAFEQHLATMLEIDGTEHVVEAYIGQNRWLWNAALIAVDGVALGEAARTRFISAPDWVLAAQAAAAE